MCMLLVYEGGTLLPLVQCLARQWVHVLVTLVRFRTFCPHFPREGELGS